MRFVPVETADEYILSNCNVQKVVKVGPSYRYTYGRKQEMTFKKYKELAIAQNRNPDNLTYSQIEDLFWKNVEQSTCFSYPKENIPIYAIDNESSRFPPNWKYWNLNEITGEVSALHSGSAILHGVNTPYLYYGMRFASFGMHHEDDNVASVNIHHGGAGRTFYGVPSSNADKLEQVSVPQILYKFDDETYLIDLIFYRFLWCFELNHSDPSAYLNRVKQEP